MLHKYLLLLSHGAGAGIDSEFMTSIIHELNIANLETIPFEFPYMKIMKQTGKRRPPDRMPKLVESFQSGLRDCQDKYPERKIIIGDKSMGGRVASLVSAELESTKPAQIEACICLGFPFHPPKKLDKYRGDHLQTLKTPVLILQGERDIMGSKDEVNLYPLAKSVTIKYIPDGDHSFKPRVRSGHTLEENISMSCEHIIEFIRSLP